MSKHIKPGMTVRIVDHPGFKSYICRKYIGRVGMVIGTAAKEGFPDDWKITNTDDNVGFTERSLEPIDHPPTWDDIETDTGWTPSVPAKTPDLVDV